MTPQRENAARDSAERTSPGALHRQQLHVDIAGDTGRGFKIVVQSNDRMSESLAKVIDYANHAKRHTADPKARENVQNVLARRGGNGGANRFEGCHESF